MKKRQIILVLSLLTVFTGCSSTKIAYSFLDWAFSWQIGKYVSLKKDQAHFSRKEIDDFHLWHRKSQLPIYANYIGGLKERLIAGEITAEQIHAETDEIQLMLDTSIEKLIPSLVTLASMLDEKQVQEIQHKLKKERSRYQKKYVDKSVPKQYKIRQKEMTKIFGRLIGRFTREQKLWLIEWSKAMLPYEELTFIQQQEWAKDLAQALTLRADINALEKHIGKLMFYHSDNWAENARETLDFNQDITFEFAARVLNNLSDKQKRHMHKQLDGYIADFTELSQQKTQASPSKTNH